MTGLIWMIQMVHYPAFHYVDRTQFAAFSVFHSRRISWIVMPIMLLELAAAVALLIESPNWVWWTNGVLLVAIWLSTFFLSVPLHARLAEGYSEAVTDRLIYTNWPRTVLWTVRSGLLLYFA